MKNLMLCNTSYQILVAMWMKYRYLSEDEVDIIITDHFKGSKELVNRADSCELFRKVYYAQTLDLIRHKISYTRGQDILHLVFPKKYIQKFVPIKEKYDALYLANFDTFSQVLYNALAHTNRSMRLYVFEEGLSTYSSFEKYYRDNREYYGHPESVLKRVLHKLVYRTKTIYGNVRSFYMFNPDLMKWKPQCDIFPMDKISCENPEFKRKVNLLFGYCAKFNEYDTKYIFFEESFLAEGTEINDIDLVNKIAARVGKENIMIKIHPRNPVNRFEKLGYKTNQCTYIPWEVILMNMEDLSDKIFITVASACVLNPFLTFHREVRAYSLYYCINQIPPILQNGLWEFVEEIYRQHQDKIRICRSVEEVN